MVVRQRRAPAKPVTQAQKRRTAAIAEVTTPVKRKPVAAPKAARPDLSRYAESTAVTTYHKAFARWIISEIGFDPDSVSSQRVAFLRGVAIATVARPAWNSSDAIETWRAENGVAKRGPKAGAKAAVAAAPPAKRGRPAKAAVAAATEPEDEFEDEDAEDLEEVDEFEDDAAEDDEEFEEFEDDDEDEDVEDEADEFDEPEPTPPPKPRGRPRKVAAPAAPAKKTAPAKATRRVAAKPVDDDKYAF